MKVLSARPLPLRLVQRTRSRASLEENYFSSTFSRPSQVESRDLLSVSTRFFIGKVSISALEAGEEKSFLQKHRRQSCIILHARSESANRQLRLNGKLIGIESISVRGRCSGIFLAATRVFRELCRVFQSFSRSPQGQRSFCGFWRAESETLEARR
jgi:hypothetical protein